MVVSPPAGDPTHILRYLVPRFPITCLEPMRVAHCLRVLQGALLLAASLTAAISAASEVTSTGNGDDSSAQLHRADEPSLRTVDLSFRDLGQFDVATLRGIDGSHYLPFGVRLDEAVTGARLTLRYAYSPAMLEEISHLRLSLNGETLNVVPLPRDGAGTEQIFHTDIDPRFFSDFNQLRIQLIGHYTLECEDPMHSSLWATISSSSRLEMDLRPITPADELALLPAPFFDRHDGGRLTLPMVLADSPSLESLQSASVLASWFGMLADYRSARFPVALDQLPEQHAVVLATNTAGPDEVTLDPVERPTISMRDNPAKAGTKLLVIQGKDDAQLAEAVDALVLGQVLLTGSRVEVLGLRRPARRAAYDAPRWLSTDRPVKFGELVDQPEQLRTRGLNGAPIRVNLRLPPDLLTWQRRGVPIDLRYRYTAPVERDNSLMSVSINNEFVQAIRLRPDDQGGAEGELSVPLLDQPRGGAADAFMIPAFQVGADNQLQFDFALDYFRQGQCQSSPRDLAQASIDPESSIDLSGFPHYTALPNLALFANASFPFSKYADLAETVVVMSDQPSVAQMEDLLFLMGRIGRHTGAAATRVRLMASSQLPATLDADLLILAGSSSAMLERWAPHLPVVWDAAQRRYLPRPQAGWFSGDLLSAQEVLRDNPDVTLRAEGGLAALLGFESPLSPERSALLITATEAQATDWIHGALEDGGLVREIRGDTALLRGRAISSHRGGDRYYVGELPWWLALWFMLSRYPLLLVVLSVAGVIILAGLAYGLLRRRAQQRLEH